jgi:hypothetical protein
MPSVHVTTEGTDIERVRKAFGERKAQAMAEFDILAEAEKQRHRSGGRW